MAFITLLIALGLIQWWGSGRPLQWDDWFVSLRSVLAGIKDATLRLGLSLLLPVLVVALFAELLEPLLFGALLLLFYVCVLLYSMGRGDFRVELDTYLSDWRRGDLEAAYQQARGMTDLADYEAVEDPVSLHREVRESVLYQGFERWFAVVFWFMVLGPTAALAYRLLYLVATDLAKDEEEQRLAQQLLHWVEWLPARLLTLSFCLTGDFAAGFRAWQESLLEDVSSRRLLARCGQAALESRDLEGDYSPERETMIVETASELEGARALISRSAVFWVLVLAVAQLF